MSWDSWSLVEKNGTFKYPDWAPTAYISMLVRRRGGLRKRRAAWAVPTLSSSRWRAAPRRRSSPPPPPHPVPPQQDKSTHQLILESVYNLRQYGIKSDWIPVRAAGTAGAGH